MRLGLEAAPVPRGRGLPSPGMARRIMGRTRWWLFSLLLLLVVLSLPAPRAGLLRTIGRALVADDPLSPADAIVLPVWAGAAGAIDTADLLRSGIATRVAVIPGPPRPAELELTRRGVAYQSESDDLVHILRGLGVKDIEIIQVQSTGTSSEAELVPIWCQREGIRSVVIVSTPDHARRLRRVLRRTVDGRTTRVYVRSARFADFDPDHWWTTRQGARTGIVEFEKLLLDVLRHPLS